jgi:hypothetical protein
VEWKAAHCPEPLETPFVRPVRGVELGDAALQLDRQPDVGVGQTEWSSDLLREVVL